MLLFTGSDMIRRMVKLKGVCSTEPFRMTFAVTEKHVSLMIIFVVSSPIYVLYIIQMLFLVAICYGYLLCGFVWEFLYLGPLENITESVRVLWKIRMHFIKTS